MNARSIVTDMSNNLQHVWSGLAEGAVFRGTRGIESHALFLAVAIAGTGALHLNGGVELLQLRRQTAQQQFEGARSGHASARSSFSADAAGVSPEVAVLIGHHRAALAAQGVAAPEGVCR